jgi:shikimate kinase
MDLGGGAFIQENNRNILKENDVDTIFLNVPFNILCERLENERDDRPLLKENWKHEAKKLFEHRYQFYEKAKFKIDIENESIDSILMMIVKKIKD